MIYIGIDPGLDGGVAFLEFAGAIHLFKTPVIGGKDYDIQDMKKMLAHYKVLGSNVFCVIENQISMPGQGLTSTLQTGKGFGIWLGLLAALEIPYQIVSARQWQTKLFTGVKGNLDTKAKSEVIAKRLFPSADFRRSERAKVASDGLTDAACIAEYARRIHNGSQSRITGIPHEALEENPDVCVKCGTFIPNSDPNDCSQPALFK